VHVSASAFVEQEGGVCRPRVIRDSQFRGRGPPPTFGQVLGRWARLALSLS
jgi:hypothetical protein